MPKHWLLSSPDRRGRADAAPFTVAPGYAAVGDSDRALEWLERTVAERDFGVVSLRTNPAFDRIKSDSRFQQLLRRLRLQ